MLTGGRASVMVTCAVAILLPVPASADPQDPKPPVTVVGDNNSGVVGTTVTAPGAPGSGAGGGQGGGSSSSGGGVTCTWKVESAYSQGVFDWIGSDPDGTWYDVTCSDGSFYPGVYVPPSAGNLPPEVALAGALARSAGNKLVLPRPQVRRNPAGAALVNLPTWWWVDPAQWTPLRQRTQAGPVWAEVTATPVSTTWDPGDGSAPVVCNGSGTPYDTSRSAESQTTDCSYAYRRSSGDQPQTGPSVNDRFFTVTVTTSWQVTWTGFGGSGGTLPVLTTSSSFPLAVVQRETVVTDGSG
jgi:hypothetical protein